MNAQKILLLSTSKSSVYICFLWANYSHVNTLLVITIEVSSGFYHCTLGICNFSFGVFYYCIIHSIYVYVYLYEMVDYLSCIVYKPFIYILQIFTKQWNLSVLDTQKGVFLYKEIAMLNKMLVYSERFTYFLKHEYRKICLFWAFAIPYNSPFSKNAPLHHDWYIFHNVLIGPVFKAGILFSLSNNKYTVRTKIRHVHT